MPITKSAKKALRQSKRRALRNKKRKKQVKEGIKLFSKNPTKKTLGAAISLIDRAVKKNIFHKNKAARLKSQLTKQLNQSHDKPKKKTPSSVSKKAPAKKLSSAKMKRK